MNGTEVDLKTFPQFLLSVNQSEKNSNLIISTIKLTMKTLYMPLEIHWLIGNLIEDKNQNKEIKYHDLILVGYIENQPSLKRGKDRATKIKIYQDLLIKSYKIQLNSTEGKQFVQQFTLESYNGKMTFLYKII